MRRGGWTHAWLLALGSCTFVAEGSGGGTGSSTGSTGGSGGTDTGLADGSDSAASADGSGSGSGGSTGGPCDPAASTFIDEFGRAASCLYVSTAGDDNSGDGSPLAPFATISHGIEAAKKQSGGGNVIAVAVAQGTYEEHVVLAGGISVLGGFDDTQGWTRPDGAETIVSSQAVSKGHIDGIFATGIAAPTAVDRITVHAGTEPVGGVGFDVYAVRIVDCSPATLELGGIVLRDVVAIAGPGGSAHAGTPGTAGEPGVGGGPGNPGSNASGGASIPGGAGSVTTCVGEVVESTASGGGGTGGGDGVWGCDTNEETATPGGPPAAASECAGGGAGDSCGCFDDGHGGGNGVACANGPAAGGTPGIAATQRGAIAKGLWAAPVGTDGGPGEHGIGGSGGGGGGSGCDALDWGKTGGSGGGGGSGGCAGAGGGAADPGGSSFGLLVVGSTISAPGSSFTSGDGGTGGVGGAGGVGGPGGAGGPGGSGGHDGGAGGSGQPGGTGGPGASGGGGSSVGVLSCMSAIAGLDDGAVDHGAAGMAGATLDGGSTGPDGMADAIVEDCSL